MLPLIITVQKKEQIATLEVNKEAFTLGRSLDCDVNVNENSISRIHAIVTVRDQKMWIEDRNSSNGTFINGKEIVKGKAVQFQEGDELRLGTSSVIIFVNYTHLENEESVEVDAEVGDSEVVDEVAMADEVNGEDEESVGGYEESDSSQVEGAELANEDLEEEVVPPDPEESIQANAEPVFAGSVRKSLAPAYMAEKVLQDAKKRAAQIVLEGEAQAERKVQSIYEKARKIHEQAEAFYEKRIAEAHASADLVLEDFQKQGQELIRDARKMSDNLREEVDSYIESLKKKAKIEADEIVAEAAKEADKIRADAVLAGHEKAKKDNESLIKLAQEEAAAIMEKAQKQLLESQEQLASEKENFDKLMREVDETQAKLLSAQLELDTTIEKQKSLAESIEKDEAHLGELQAAQKATLEQKKNVDVSIQALNEKHVNLSINIQDMEAKRTQLIKESESLKAHLTEKIEKEKNTLIKAEEERSEEVRLEFAKKMKKMEQDMVDNLLQRKMTLVREIHGAVEKEVVQLVEAANWRKISANVQARIGEAFDDKVASLSQSVATSQKPDDLLKKRTYENLRWAFGGLVVGLALFLTTDKVLEKMRKDKSPMQTRVTNEAKQRQADLERRRFNPPQTGEAKETYTDSVIYTRDFVAIYMEQDYQQRLYKEMSQYLLKTWRLDEETSLRALSAVQALVKELVDKKTKIHPDFVKEGVEKMHKLENETLGRMKEILGSEVRLESFRRFENEFYAEELKRRGLAQR